jgi:hypothetical protein
VEVPPLVARGPQRLQQSRHLLDQLVDHPDIVTDHCGRPNLVRLPTSVSALEGAGNTGRIQVDVEMKRPERDPCHSSGTTSGFGHAMDSLAFVSFLLTSSRRATA